ncbi:F-box/kelch-repeat protein At3g23880-like [Quercus lobata]|uniref:F-box domain-containing protein n=1 Tax=Quercus lobata TaxID=97700 RepID=A0A7N2KY78_QUELO|nr:F-box/kelch-repeat protein At3g23880-like [Quercus lobata]
MSDNSPPEVSKSWTEEEEAILWDSLPPEILTHILVRLPIKSIITCTCVSKTWKSLILNPTFISTHLHHSSSNNNNLLLFRLCPKPLVEAFDDMDPIGDEKEVYALHRDDMITNFDQYTRFDDFPFHRKSCSGIFRVVGTCNGLICLADDLNDHCPNFYLWNPCVKKYVRLPFPYLLTAGFYTVAVGFGFDSKTNDYKVVMFVTRGYSHDHEVEVEVEVGVYSLATGKWREATAERPKCAVRNTVIVDLRLQAFVNGALHLVCHKTTPEIRFLYFVLVFDLEDEVFREIPLPKHSDMFFWKWVSIMAFGNSIAVFKPGYSVNTPDIWVLKNYSDASSWTKIISLDAQAPPQRPPSRFYRVKTPSLKAFRKSGEAILQTHKKRLISKDLETKEVKDLGITGSKYSFVDSYVQSLVLLDKPDLANPYPY